MNAEKHKNLFGGILILTLAAVITVRNVYPHSWLGHAMPIAEEMQDDLKLHEVAIRHYTDCLLQTNVEIVKIQKQLKLLINTNDQAALHVKNALSRKEELLESQLSEFKSNQTYWSDQRDGLVSVLTCLELVEQSEFCFVAYDITMKEAEFTNMDVCIEVHFCDLMTGPSFYKRCAYYVYLQKQTVRLRVE